MDLLSEVLNLQVLRAFQENNWFSVRFWRALGGPRVSCWRTPRAQCLLAGAWGPGPCHPSDIPLPPVPWSVSPFPWFIERSVPVSLFLLSLCSIQMSGSITWSTSKGKIRAFKRIVDRYEHLAPPKSLSLTTTSLCGWFEAQGEEHHPKGCISGQEEIWALLTYRGLRSASFFSDNCSLHWGKDFLSDSHDVSAWLLCPSKRSLREGKQSRGGFLKIHPPHWTDSFHSYFIS